MRTGGGIVATSDSLPVAMTPEFAVVLDPGEGLARGQTIHSALDAPPRGTRYWD